MVEQQQPFDEPPLDSTPVDSHVTQNETGGIFVFGEPIGVNVVTIAEGRSIRTELNQNASIAILASIEEVLREDFKAKKNWADFGGIVVNLATLRALVHLGIVTNKQIINAQGDQHLKKLTLTFSAARFHTIFSGNIDPIVPGNSPYYEKKLIIVDDESMRQLYGGSYPFVTIDKNEQIL